jgi:hypothetical protein
MMTDDLHGAPRTASFARRAAAVVIAGLTVSGVARADGAVTVEGGGGVNKPGSALPSSGFAYDRLAVRNDVSSAVTVGGGLRMTRDFATTALPGSRLHTGADWVFVLSGDVSYAATPHLTLGVGASASPRSTRDVATTISLGSGDAPALVRASTSTLGASVDVGYDTFDEEAPHDVDALVELSLGLNRYATSQDLASLETGSCDSRASCGKPAAPAFDDAMTQARIEASTLFTFAERFEAGVGAGVYAYPGSDPTLAGTTVGAVRDASGAAQGSARYGVGFPLIAAAWMIRAEGGVRFSGVAIRAYVQHAKYVYDGESGDTLGLRAQTKLGASLRLYVTGTYRADTAPDATSHSYFGGLGMSVRW